MAEAVLFPIPTASNALYTVRIPGLVAVNNTNGLVIVSPLAANFFRPNAPNYFFLAANGVSKAVFDSQIGGSVRTPGAITPFGDVSAQLSDGNSNYNALNLELKQTLLEQHAVPRVLHVVAFNRRLIGPADAAEAA